MSEETNRHNILMRLSTVVKMSLHPMMYDKLEEDGFQDFVNRVEALVSPCLDYNLDDVMCHTVARELFLWYIHLHTCMELGCLLCAFIIKISNVAERFFREPRRAKMLLEALP